MISYIEHRERAAKIVSKTTDSDAEKTKVASLVYEA